MKLRIKLFSVLVLSVVLAMSVCSLAFATATVTAEQMTPITTTLTDNLGVLLPVGITIMGVMIGVALIPRIIYKFF